MVLQRDLPVRIWGNAPAGSEITVRFNNAEKVCISSENGKWEIVLPPMHTSSSGETMNVSCSNRIHQSSAKFKNILIGDVWLCGGQSNMKMHLSETDMERTELFSLEDSDIRVTQIPARVAGRPMEDLSAVWERVAPDNAHRLPALPFYFAREIRKEINVPVGLISAAHGHTPIEAWISQEALISNTSSRKTVEQWKAALNRTPGLIDRLWDDLESIRRRRKESGYEEKFAAWYTEAKSMKSRGLPPPPQPERLTGPGDTWSPTVLYNGMIAPLFPFVLRGIIWYQGETNAILGNSYLYRELFPLLIRSWRNSWNSELPFYFVQLANHDDVQTDNADDKWAELREAQCMALKIPGTGMVVAIDVGERMEIHPKNKNSVGKRLARLAVAGTYGKKTVASAPLYESMTPEGSRCRIRFAPHEIPISLKISKGGNGLEIAGDNQVYLPAEAEISDNTLLVWNDTVKTPVAVRYAWAADPACSLFGPDDLPVSPFRTDNWTRHTEVAN